MKIRSTFANDPAPTVEQSRNDQEWLTTSWLRLVMQPRETTPGPSLQTFGFGWSPAPKLPGRD